MATGTKIGKDTSVRLGSYIILGLGTWNMTGVTIDQYEDTSFGDEWKTFVPGLKDGGQLTFAGVYKPADSTGQQALRVAADAGTNITDIRFYVDATSYWIPKTTNPASYVNVTEWSVSADKSGVMQTSFTCKVSGEMELL